MSDNEGAARAQSRQPTPLFNTAPARRDPDRERTPPKELGAHTIRALLLPTPAVDRDDTRTERRRLRLRGTPHPAVGKNTHPQDGCSFAILHPLSDTTPKDLTTAGSATYQPTYVQDHPNAQRMCPRTVSPNYATGTHTRASADRMPEAERPLPPQGTYLDVHTAHQPVSRKVSRVWTWRRQERRM